MKAEIVNPQSNCNGSAHRKEKYFSREFAALDRKTGDAIATLRIYNSPSNSCNYACVWIHVKQSKRFPEGLHASGSARASGYGYHRASQAAEDAITRAGFTLDQTIGGAGDGAIRDAVQALAVCVGCRTPIIHEAHA